jgi:hypothetical protein
MELSLKNPNDDTLNADVTNIGNFNGSILNTAIEYNFIVLE